MQKIKNYIKNSLFFSYIYKLIFSSLYFIMDHSLEKKKKIIFVSFSGRQYSDSPKVLFEQIKKREEFQDFEFIWAFNDPNKFKDIDGARIVNINSVSYLKELFSSQVWISNASIEKLVPYKPKGIFYLNTWHGVPLKKIGADEKQASPLIKNWYKKVQFDLLVACSDYDETIFKHIFPNHNKIIKSGLPRNFELFYSTEKVKLVKEEFLKTYQLDSTKRLILYAPTFRETGSDEVNEILVGNILPKEADNCYLLVRTHYFEKLNTVYQNVIDVSEYDLTKLMNLSDCLITDYSSLMFDYALLRKPIYLYCYDYDNYFSTRGLYIDIRKDYHFPILSKNNINNIYQCDDEKLIINSHLDKMNLVCQMNENIILEEITKHLTFGELN